LQHIATAFRIHGMGPLIFVEEWFHSLWRRKFLAWSCGGKWNNYCCFTAASYIRKRLRQRVLRHLGRLRQVIFKT